MGMGNHKVATPPKNSYPRIEQNLHSFLDGMNCKSNNFLQYIYAYPLRSMSHAIRAELQPRSWELQERVAEISGKGPMTLCQPSFYEGPSIALVSSHLLR